MSGIEVVGLALGLWPVIVNLAQLFKASKDGSPVRGLTMNIAVYERIFKQSVLKLLQGDEELLEKDRIGLVNGDENFAAIWKDDEFIARLGRRLDAEMFILVQQKMEEIFKLLTSLKKKIEPKDGESKGHIPRLKNVKLVLQKDEIKKNLNSLKEHVNGMRMLVESCSTTSYSMGPRNDGQGHRRDSGDRKRRRSQDAQFFNDFFEVLNQSFRCQCAVAHEANLRICDSLEIMFPVQEINRAMSEPRLRARSATIDSLVTAAPTDLEEIDITSEIFRATWSRPKSVSSVAAEHRALLVIFNHSRGVRNVAPIADLCQWIKTVRSTSPPNSPTTDCQGVLGKDGEKYTASAPRANADPVNAPTVMSMDDCLSSCDSYGISRRTRLHLALTLASAIVQFYQTSWIERAWTWRNFSMMKAETTLDLVITRRFWSSEAPEKGIAPAPSKFWRCLRDKDPMLVRLGFALIELAMGKRLSDMRLLLNGQKETKEAENEAMEDMEDYNTALDLVEKNIIMDEVGVAYQRVVAACLECKVLGDDGTKLLRSGFNGFEDDVEEFIVGPLRQYNINTWGKITAF